MSNHLVNETSPYLLQHAENPVDWYPWGEEAFARARREDKPVFLSIGYSTCHWCHVMAHESFENGEIAALLNRHFISIKVDREERPDIDGVYMAVCQAFTGSGGWPASLFLTPEQKPFFAGTYFPPASRYGSIGFRDLLRTVADKWERDRTKLLHSAEEILGQLAADGPAAEEIDRSRIGEAVTLFSRSFDRKYGGFGEAPKFPAPHNLLFLLAYSQLRGDPRALEMVTVTLIQMRKGGIFDHIGYGFSRYSTDRYYLVPHFEKMLYDNALLIMAYAAAYAVTKDESLRDTAEKTAAYVLREMRSPEGLFYAAQDADSDGVEGKYYLFGYDEILTVLGAEAGKKFCAYYGVTPKGNFEGRNILNRLHAKSGKDACDDLLPRLYEYRREREKLHLDDKILTAWNGLMIAALALLYRVTARQDYLSAALTAQHAVETCLMENGRLCVSYRGGRRTGKAFLDDYAFYAAALLGLYEATADSACLEQAKACCREADEQFRDADNGGYFLSGRENERLVLHLKETYDGAMPSGNAMMACLLVRLSQITEEPPWKQAAEEQLRFLSGESKPYPAGHSLYLLALLLHDHPPDRITVVPADPAEAGEVRRKLPLYAQVTVLDGPTGEYRLLDGKTTYYVCRRNTCLPPANTL